MLGFSKPVDHDVDQKRVPREGSAQDKVDVGKLLGELVPKTLQVVADVSSGREKIREQQNLIGSLRDAGSARLDNVGRSQLEIGDLDNRINRPRTQGIGQIGQVKICGFAAAAVRD